MGKAVRAEGVQTDVQPVHARLTKGTGKPGEGRPVGGQTQLLHAVQGGDAPADFHNSPADQGLAAGEADLPHAQAHCLPGDLHQLLHRTDPAPGQLGHASGGHAVAAAEIAQIRHRQTQIGNVPGIGVLHGGLLFKQTLRREQVQRSRTGPWGGRARHFFMNMISIAEDGKKMQGRSFSYTEK